MIARLNLKQEMMNRRNVIVIMVLLLTVLHVDAQLGVQPGDRAPLFKAADQNGRTIDLAEKIKEGPVVLFFYRGQWCPYCNRYLSDLQDSLHYITDKGAFVVAITPEKGEGIDKTVEKTGAQFSLVYDEGHQIMDAYDVTFELSGSKHLMYKAAGIDINKASGNEDRALPIPATFIIDQKGRVQVRHFEMDYKQRMTVEHIIEAL